MADAKSLNYAAASAERYTEEAIDAIRVSYLTQLREVEQASLKDASSPHHLSDTIFPGSNSIRKV